MERKLVKQGANTLFVSLPAKWIKENGLDKGNTVNITQSEDKLEISTNHVKKLIEANIIITSSDKEYLRSHLTPYYQNNTMIWNIAIDSPSTESEFPKIESEIQELFIGMETIQISSNKIIVQNISSDNSQLLNNMLTKMIFKAELLLKTNDLKEKDKIRKSTYRIKSYIQRIVASKQIKQSEAIYLYSTRLNQIVSNLSKANLNSPITENLISIFNKFKQLHLEKFSNIGKPVQKKEHEKIRLEYENIFNNKIKHIFTESTDNESAFYLLSAIKNIYLANGTLSGIDNE